MTTTTDPYVRAVDLVRVIDGDTFLCDVDLGFYVRARMSCRLAGINAPDHGEGGRTEATAALLEVLHDADLSVQSVHADKYAGRFDARVFAHRDGTTIDVNQFMIDLGMAVAWDGKGTRPIVPWPPHVP